MFDLDATIHDAIHPGGLSQSVSVLVDHAQLLPKAGGPDGLSVSGDGFNVCGFSKAIDDIDFGATSGGRLFQAGIAGFT
jgi:hypothetical protein